MNFGRLAKNQLTKTNLGLHPEPPFNKLILKGKRSAKPAVYIGCSKWGIKEWVGTLYPRGLKESDFLDEYLKHFNSIELNATHYKLYEKSDIQKWATKSKSKDFKFCPKFYQGISHWGNLKDKSVITDQFLSSISAFSKNLAPLFLQLNDRFAPKRKEELFSYLNTLPAGYVYFVEVRHADWFMDPHWNDLLSLLKRLKMGIVITDTAGRRDCCHMHLTLPKTFVRFVGNSLHPTDYKRADDWVKRIGYWPDNGLREIYFFMHMHDEATSPQLAGYLVGKLNDDAGLNLKAPLITKTKKKSPSK